MSHPRGNSGSRDRTLPILRTYKERSRGGAGEAQAKRRRRAGDAQATRLRSAVSGARMTAKSVAEFSESWGLRLVEVGAEISKGGVRRLAKWGATISKGGCDV
jgi:hypothetical protein